jgi:hypothetical protein
MEVERPQPPSPQDLVERDCGGLSVTGHVQALRGVADVESSGEDEQAGSGRVVRSMLERQAEETAAGASRTLSLTHLQQNVAPQSRGRPQAFKRNNPGPQALDQGVGAARREAAASEASGKGPQFPQSMGPLFSLCAAK